LLVKLLILIITKTVEKKLSHALDFNKLIFLSFFCYVVCVFLGSCFVVMSGMDLTENLLFNIQFLHQLLFIVEMFENPVFMSGMSILYYPCPQPLE